MAMPVMGATAVASRVSVRAKSNFHGARVAGVRPVAPRPAAVQTRASARVVEQADDLQLGQVRPSQPPNIRAIDVVDELLPIDPRARPSSDSAPRSGVDSNRRVRDAFAAPRDRARARAVAPRPRRGFRVRANVVHQPTRRNCGYADATSIGSRSANPQRTRRDSNTNLTFALPITSPRSPLPPLTFGVRWTAGRRRGNLLLSLRTAMLVQLASRLALRIVAVKEYCGLLPFQYSRSNRVFAISAVALHSFMVLKTACFLVAMKQFYAWLRAWVSPGTSTSVATMVHRLLAS